MSVTVMIYDIIRHLVLLVGGMQILALGALDAHAYLISMLLIGIVAFISNFDFFSIRYLRVGCGTGWFC